MLEIERKYLVKSTAYRQVATSKKYLVQGFLNTHPDRTVRVRILEDTGFLTIKGRSNETGTSRFEWEHVLSLGDANNLLALCEAPLMEKYRYCVPFGGHIFEVDEFQGVNQGLVVAEVELLAEEETVLKPEWLGIEVTGRNKYYNSQLIKNPYTTWDKKEKQG